MDAQKESMRMRAVDFTLMAFLGAMIVLPFSANIAPIAVIDTFKQTADVDGQTGSVTTNMRGNIGIFSIQPQCWFEGDDGVTDCFKENDDEDAKLEEQVNIWQTTKEGVCDWKQGFLDDSSTDAKSKECKDERHDWCESSQGLAITSLVVILLPALFYLIVTMGTQYRIVDSPNYDYAILAAYVLVGIFVFAVAGNTSDIVTKAPKDCGFDPTDTDGFSGTGVIASGTYIYFAVGIICFCRALGILIKKIRIDMPQSLIFWVYTVFLVLAIVASVSPIVTITDIDHATQTVTKLTVQAWSSHTITHVISGGTPKTTHDHEWMKDTCTAGGTGAAFGNTYPDCESEFKDWCYNTHITNIFTLAVLGIAMAATLYQLIKGYTAGDQMVSMIKYSHFHLLMMALLTVVTGVHSAWTTMMVNSELDQNGECGFDPKNGSDGGGPALYMTHIIAWSSLIMLFILQCYTDKNTGELAGFRLML